MKPLLIAGLLGGALLAMDAQAQSGDPEAGKDKIASCAACHGTDGMGTAPIYPNLAGQSATYLESAMKAYRDGKRGGGMSAIMAPQAQGLSDEDIADMSAYYASLEP